MRPALSSGGRRVHTSRCTAIRHYHCRTSTEVHTPLRFRAPSGPLAPVCRPDTSVFRPRSQCVTKIFRQVRQDAAPSWCRLDTSICRPPAPVSLTTCSAGEVHRSPPFSVICPSVGTRIRRTVDTSQSGAAGPCQTAPPVCPASTFSGCGKYRDVGLILSGHQVQLSG